MVATSYSDKTIKDLAELQDALSNQPIVESGICIVSGPDTNVVSFAADISLRDRGQEGPGHFSMRGDFYSQRSSKTEYAFSHVPSDGSIRFFVQGAWKLTESGIFVQGAWKPTDDGSMAVPISLSETYDSGLELQLARHR